ncbi:MAG: acyl-CoA reductase [Sporomusaceae bacterium]|nr:acyl-CoA reductase [Sporomusaceae bacterium]
MDSEFVKLAGEWPIRSRPRALFSPLVMDFLAQLEAAIKSDNALFADPSYQAFAFWLRRKHVESFRQETSHSASRMGRGIVFHIAPANIPVMFAYSLVLALLAGNCNVIRLSPRTVQQAAPLIAVIARLLEREEFSELKAENVLISYERNASLTDRLSLLCDMRVLWGGDASITEIRKSPLAPHATDVVFADRFSLAVFDSEFVHHCSDNELALWAHRFYNDTYAMDQNACSSPKIIFWLNSKAKEAVTVLAEARRRWWEVLARQAADYALAPIKVSQKYSQLWQFGMTCPELATVDCFENRLYVATMKTVPDDITLLSGKFGLFFQAELTELADLPPLLTTKVQTISVLGIDPAVLRRMLLTSRVTGGDRIVSVGQAMEMDVIWDGVNLLERLSRIIR